MAKRYGRNQKKKHLEEMARMQGLVDLTNYNYEAIKRRTAHLFQTIKEIEPNSLFLDPQETSGTYPLAPLSLRIASMGQTKEKWWEQSTEMLAEQVHFDELLLYKMEAFVYDHPEQFRKAVHLKYRDKEVAYYLSEDGFRLIPKDMLVNIMLPRAVRELVSLLKEEKK